MNLRLCSFVCSVLLAGSIANADGLEASDAWIRQPPPATNAAAYMKLANPGKDALRVVSVRSAVAKRVELHETTVKDGVARMNPVDSVEIPPGKTVVFAPRGLHVMLIEPAPLKIGQRVTLEVVLADGATLAVEAEVRAGMPGKAEDHSQHHH